VKRLSRESLRVAVIGLGKMGLLHASILNTLPNVELNALCDKGALIRKFCKKVLDKVRVVDDVEKLSDLNLDVAYVTTPIPSHFIVMETLYSRRIARNVFVEKTLASSFDEAKKLCELAQSFGGLNMVGYMKRFAVTFRKAKDLLNQDVLGDVVCGGFAQPIREGYAREIYLLSSGAFMSLYAANNIAKAIRRLSRRGETGLAGVICNSSGDEQFEKRVLSEFAQTGSGNASGRSRTKV